MKIMYNGEKVGAVITNRSLTVKEALYSIGYDVDNADDLKRAYENGFSAAYIDDTGAYQVDEENIELVY